MRTAYDIYQPRISVRPPPQDDYSDVDREMEIGQVEAMGEAVFFLSIGYSVGIAEWNGKIFVNRCNYFPGDL
jgi:hypothetical protein